MTKTQIWLGGFVLLFIALFMLGRLTKKDDTESQMKKMEAMMQKQQDNQEASIAPQLNRLNCTRCHGGDLKGTPVGPTLYGLKNSWDRDGLINYLRNPSSYMSSDKFKIYKDKYKNVVMPAYNNVDVKELGQIADYLLNLK